VSARYDTIGVDYAWLRRPDPRIAAQIDAALGSARTVLNVGAGTGSYEPVDRRVTAIEPSEAMIRQRDPAGPPVIRGSAEQLPFADGSFDAAMAVLTIHHWSDKARGLAEVRRVTRGPIVLLTFDPAFRGAWLTDYLPELIALYEAVMPSLLDLERWLGQVSAIPVPVPHDCTDGFLYAYWRRPEAYLDARVRSGSSAFWLIDGLDAGLDRLRDDLANGEWHRRYGDVLSRETLDLGYRLVIAW
jgi:SAM-dependent methyltransferase